LGGVESDTYFFFFLLDLLAFGSCFLVLQFKGFFLLEILLFELLLKASIESIICCQELEILLVARVRH